MSDEALKFLQALALVLIHIVIMVLIVMFFWNSIASSIFNLPKLTVLDSAGLLILTRVLIGDLFPFRS